MKLEPIELGSILQVAKGKKPARQSEKCEEGFLPYVDIQAFEQGAVSQYTDGEKCLPCEDGDILIVCDGARSGLVGRAIKGYVGSTLAVLKARGVCNSYLFHFIAGKYALLNTKMKGTGTPHLNMDVLKKQKIIVPSIEKQERIVSKIEELFSEIDNAISSLKTAKRKLEIYRSAVLKHAFSNSDKWEKLSLGELMKEVRNGCGTKPSDSGNYKILTIGSVRAMKVAIDEHRYNDKPFDEKDRIHENDLLFTRYNGSREFVGVCGVVPRLSESYAYPDKLIRFTPKINNSIHSKYIQFYVSQGKARRYIRSKIKTSSGQNGIAGSDLKKTEIHLPSLQEQKRIVENIELKFGVYEDIDCTISCALRRAESLKQSILKKAFEGELL